MRCPICERNADYCLCPSTVGELKSRIAELEAALEQVATEAIPGTRFYCIARAALGPDKQFSCESENKNKTGEA